MPNVPLRARLPILLSVATYGVIVLTLFQVWSVRRNSGAIADRLRDAVPEMARTSQDAAPPAVVFYLFQARDCRDALASLDVWNELHRSGRARVQGLLLRDETPEPARRALVARAGLRFPITETDAAPVLQALADLGYTRTPVAILVDPAGRIRMTAAATDPAGAGAIRDLVHTRQHPRAIAAARMAPLPLSENGSPP